MKTTTLRRIQQHNIAKDWDNILRKLGKDSVDDVPISFVEIRDKLGIVFAVKALRVNDPQDNKKFADEIYAMVPETEWKSPHHLRKEYAAEDACVAISSLYSQLNLDDEFWKLVNVSFDTYYGTS